MAHVTAATRQATQPRGAPLRTQRVDTLTAPAPARRRTGPTRVGAALSGLVSVAAGVAVAHLLAGLTSPSRSPFVAVGGAFIDLTPTWLKEYAVATFGTADKAVLLSTIGVLIAVASLLIGLLSRRARRTAVALAGAVGLVAAVAALSRPGASALDALPSVVGAATAAGALLWLTRPKQDALRDDPSSVGDAPLPSRRSVLAGVLGVAGAAVVAGGLGEVIGRIRSDTTASRAAIRLPAPVDPAKPLPAGVEVGVDGVTPFRVANADFYRVDTNLVVPNVDVASWTLDIGGMVDRPYSLTFDELLAMPMVERDLTLTCVSNEVGGQYAGNARWLGVRVSDLLARAGVSPDADQLISRSTDGWTASTPIAAVTDSRDAIVAVAMNGEPLPAEHGFPARMVVPGLYGFVSATKWLVSLEPSTYAAEQAYWTKRGWATDAPVRTMARIDVPRPLSTVAPGRVAIAGVCWAQHRGIDGVEVQVDDGPWRTAKLGAVPSDDTWRQWVLPWDATSGRHTIRARATDSTGTTQPSARLTPFPSGAQGWHEVVVTVS